MLKYINFLLIFFFTLNILKANQIDIGIFESETVGSQIEVKIRPDFDIQSNQTVTGILYTVRWDDPAINITAQYIYPFFVAPQGSPVLYNGHYYQVFAAVPLTPFLMNANDEYLVSTFTYTNGGCANFEIIEDEWTQANNGDFYIEFLGIEVTGIRYESSINFGSIGGSIEGNEIIIVNNSTGPMNLINYQGSIISWQRNIDETFWTNIPGTSGLVTYSETPMTVGNYNYRVGVQNETCEIMYSDILSIEVILHVDINLSVKVFLEGSFMIGEMTTKLNQLDYIPLIQPYSGSPWNYNGTETLLEMSNPSVVDWVLVELRDAPDPYFATPVTQIARQAALLLSNGDIVDLDGSTLHFLEAINQQLFIIIWHRNHIGIMSANGLNPNPEGIYTYDFTTAVSQAYGNGQKSLGIGNFGMIAGDANADGFINNSDIIQNWRPQTGTSGYLNGDFNLNGEVNNQDKNDCLMENINQQTNIPE